GSGRVGRVEQRVLPNETFRQMQLDMAARIGGRQRAALRMAELEQFHAFGGVGDAREQQVEQRAVRHYPARARIAAARASTCLARSTTGMSIILPSNSIEPRPAASASS